MTKNAVIGNRIREARKLLGLTQEQLSQMTGMSRSLIDKYENGTRRVHADTVSTICQSLNVSADIVLGTNTDSIMIEDFVGKKDVIRMLKMSKEFTELLEQILAKEELK